MTATPSTPQASSSTSRYWRSNLLLTVSLLLIWAAVSLGCGILWAPWLNQWNLPGTGYPLGFWFSQQGAILTFVVLILAYAVGMNRLDRAHLAERKAAAEEKGQPE